MNFVELKTEILSVTHNGITYTKEIFKTTDSITGVVDDVYPNWDTAVPYSRDDYVIVPELKSIYKSASSNTGKFPPAHLDSDWVFWGYINSVRMFADDEDIGSRTVGTDITISTDFNQSDSFCLLDINFTSDAIVEQIDNDTLEVVHRFPISSRDISCSDFAEYCYTSIKQRRKFITTGLTWLPNSTLKITFTGEVALGTFGSGILEELGITLLQTNLRWESKSLVKNDEFTGYRNVLRYGKIRVLEATVIFNTDDFDSKAQRIDEILDKNILFVPTLQDKFSELMQIGYMEDFSMPFNKNTIETTTTIIGVPR